MIAAQAPANAPLSSTVPSRSARIASAVPARPTNANASSPAAPRASAGLTRRLPRVARRVDGDGLEQSRPCEALQAVTTITAPMGSLGRWFAVATTPTPIPMAYSAPMIATSAAMSRLGATSSRRDRERERDGRVAARERRLQPDRVDDPEIGAGEDHLLQQLGGHHRSADHRAGRRSRAAVGAAPARSR